MSRRDIQAGAAELRAGVELETGVEYRLVLGVALRFLRGPHLVRPGPDGEPAELRPTPVVSPLEASVAGRLHRWGRRPLDGELVTIELADGAASTVTVEGAETVTVEMERTAGGARSRKKLLFWHGDRAALEDAAWDDIQLVDVTAAGEVPFLRLVIARAGAVEATLGLIDVLFEDPDAPGAFRTARHGLFRTRTPQTRFVVPNLPLADVRIVMDDGADETPDEIDVTRLVRLGEPVTPLAAPGWVLLDDRVTGELNTDVGRLRLVQPSVDEPTEGGDVGLFLFGENRLRLERGPAETPEVLFVSHSLHYLEDNQTVAGGHYLIDTVEAEGSTVQIVKGSLTLDFADDATTESMSRALHALRLRPRSLAGRFRIVEGHCDHATDGAALLALRDQILGYGDAAISGVSLTPCISTEAAETGLQERYPEILHADFTPATRTFANRDIHWHHFVIHTFPAHRLLEHHLLPNSRPPTIAVGGLHFDTRMTFVRPEAADDLRRIRELDQAEPARRIGVFGHTDRVGGDASNDQLSLARAQSMEALLRHAEGWWYDRFSAGTEILGDGRADAQWALTELGLYTGPIDGAAHPEFDTALANYHLTRGVAGSGINTAFRRAVAVELRTHIGATSPALTNETAWGTREIQRMLRHLGHYAGPINGVNNAATRTGVRAFQTSHSLSADGDVGIATRILLIRDYQAALVPAAFDAARFHPGAVFGCGEAFPRVPTADGVESVQNRRVEVIFRRTAGPMVPGAIGATVPYLEWTAPEFDAGTPPAIPNVVVAVTDTGFGRAAPFVDNWSGEQATQPNPWLIEGRRWMRPTDTTGVAAANPSNHVVGVDGNLTPSTDLGGHGSAVVTCFASDGVGSQVGGAARGPLNAVLGTAPHVRVRPIRISSTGQGPGAPATTFFFSYMCALEVIATDPDVLVYTTSMSYHSVAGGVGYAFTPAQVVAFRTRAEDLVMQGKVMVSVPQNYAAGFPGNYEAARTQWGQFGPDRRNPRSSNTAANEWRQRLLIVGNMGRVGTGLAAMVAAPGLPEVVALSTYVGVAVGVHMPGHNVRAMIPSAIGMAGGLSTPTVIPAPDGMTVGGITGTSFATPMTAGVIAELMLLDADLRLPANVARVIEYVEATADPMIAINPAGGVAGQPARGLDTLINPGGAAAGTMGAHPAFNNIRRVNYWKAVLAALNKGLSSEGRVAAGATDNHFTFCTLRADGDADCRWYGLEIRSWQPDCVVWFRRPGGEHVLAEDVGALLPADRVIGTTWRTVDTLQNGAGQSLPAFPWLPVNFTAAGRPPFFLCQISIEKAKLALYDALIVHLPGIDPRDPEGADGPPVLQLDLTNRVTLRSPAAAGGAIASLVTAFDDFVFHVTAAPQAFASFRFLIQDNRTGSGIGESILVRLWAVDAFGHVTRPPPAPVNVSHNGTSGGIAFLGGVPFPTGVLLNGANAANGASIPVIFGAPGDPPSLARINFQGWTAETVRLSAVGNPGFADIVVAAAGAVTELQVEVRRAGGGPSPVTQAPRAGEEGAGPPAHAAALELVVRAVDTEGRTVATFADEVQITLLQGAMGTEGPPSRSGVHIKEVETTPFGAARFTYRFTIAGATPDAGQHVFPFFAYTTGPLQFRVASGAIEGTSETINVVAGPATRLLVQATTPETQGTSFNVVVTAMDAFANRVETFEAAVQLATVAGFGTAPSAAPVAGVHIGDTAIAGDETYTYAHTDGGLHRFPVTCHTAETVRFQATSPPAGGAGAITGTSNDVVVGATGALDHFRFDLRGVDRAGGQFEVRVIAEDAAGHTLTTFVQVAPDNVILSVVAAFGTAFIPGPPPAGNEITIGPGRPGAVGNSHQYVAADRGVFSFWVVPHTAETLRLQANCSNPPVVSSSADIVVGEGGTIDHFSVVAPGAAVHGVPFNVVVTAQDVSNNRVPIYLGQVNVRAGAAAVPAGAFLTVPGGTPNHVFVSGDAGQFTFSITLPAAGTFFLRAQDPNGNFRGVSAAVVVT